MSDGNGRGRRHRHVRDRRRQSLAGLASASWPDAQCSIDRHAAGYRNARCLRSQNRGIRCRVDRTRPRSSPVPPGHRRRHRKTLHRQGAKRLPSPAVAGPSWTKIASELGTKVHVVPCDSFGNKATQVAKLVGRGRRPSWAARFFLKNISTGQQSRATKGQPVACEKAEQWERGDRRPPHLPPHADDGRRKRMMGSRGLWPDRQLYYGQRHHRQPGAGKTRKPQGRQIRNVQARRRRSLSRGTSGSKQHRTGLHPTRPMTRCPATRRR